MKIVILCGIVVFSGMVYGAQSIKDGDKVAFLGDSITQFGNRPDGYARLVENGLAANGIRIEVIPAGVGGDKSDGMRKRLPGLLAKKPDWLLLSCGVNDVGHGKKGISLEAYENNINAILDTAAAAGVQVMLLTPTLIGETLENGNNQKLNGYCAFLRKQAKERNLLLADQNLAVREATQKSKTQKSLKITVDGLHMNGYGNQVMAITVLHAFGVSPQQIERLRPEWDKIPSMPPILNAWYNPKYKISIQDYELLLKEAEGKGKSVDDYCFEVILHQIKHLKKGAEK